MSRSCVIRPCSSLRASALALGLASVVIGAPAVAGATGAAGGADAIPMVVAQVGSGIPMSPAFRMNVAPNVVADEALPIGSHDAPAKAAPAARGASAASVKNPRVAAPAKADKDPQGAKAPDTAKAPEATAAADPRHASEAARPPASSPSAPGTAKPVPAALDPFEHLRERLAQTLGAAPAGAGGKFVLRVSNRGESGDNVVSTAHADHVASLSTARRPTQRAAAASDAQSAAGGGAAMAATGWDYAGLAGPESWARLQPEFEKCAHGTRQSPIDIRDGIAVDLEPIQFDYHPGAFTVVDTGRTVQVNVAPGSTITLQGRRYELQEFHFHRPSEERIDGRQFDMTVHLVHKDAEGRQAVVAVLLERGSALPVVQSVWNNLPLEKNEAVHASGPLDPSQLLPEDRRYYTYMGSLTTPPCTEGVLWMVMKRPVQLSGEQDAIFARLYPMNARPVQAASGRLVKESQ